MNSMTEKQKKKIEGFKADIERLKGSVKIFRKIGDHKKASQCNTQMERLMKRIMIMEGTWIPTKRSEVKKREEKLIEQENEYWNRREMEFDPS